MRENLGFIVQLSILKLAFAPLFFFFYIIFTLSKFFTDDTILLENRELDKVISVITTLICLVLVTFLFSNLYEQRELNRVEQVEYQKWCAKTGGFFLKNKCEK